MAQASKAIIPKDAGGPTGKRIGTTVGGSLGWGLRVNGFVTERTSSSEWLRYSLVVLNCVCSPFCDYLITELLCRERPTRWIVESHAYTDDD